MESVPSTTRCIFIIWILTFRIMESASWMTISQLTDCVKDELKDELNRTYRKGMAVGAIAALSGAILGTLLAHLI